jgi:2-methylcitrate dehydratase PrpD
VGLTRGKAGLGEYTNAAATDPIVKLVRERVTAIADASVTEDQSRIEVELTDGRKITKFVEESLGNLRKPLTDHDLDEKLRDQSVPILTAPRTEKLIELLWRIDTLDDAGDIVKATAPA